MDVYSLSNVQLITELKKCGFSAGPIVPTTRKLYEKKLMRFLNDENSVKQDAPDVKSIDKNTRGDFVKPQQSTVLKQPPIQRSTPIFNERKKVVQKSTTEKIKGFYQNKITAESNVQSLPLEREQKVNTIENFLEKSRRVPKKITKVNDAALSPLKYEGKGEYSSEDEDKKPQAEKDIGRSFTAKSYRDHNEVKNLNRTTDYRATDRPNVLESRTDIDSYQPIANAHDTISRGISFADDSVNHTTHDVKESGYFTVGALIAAPNQSMTCPNQSLTGTNRSVVNLTPSRVPEMLRKHREWLKEAGYSVSKFDPSLIKSRKTIMEKKAEKAEEEKQKAEAELKEALKQMEKAQNKGSRNTMYTVIVALLAILFWIIMSMEEPQGDPKMLL